MHKLLEVQLHFAVFDARFSCLLHKGAFSTKAKGNDNASQDTFFTSVLCRSIARADPTLIPFSKHFENEQYFLGIYSFTLSLLALAAASSLLLYICQCVLPDVRL